MTEDRLQLQRFELKYLVSEEIALSVRQFIASYLEIDEFAATRPNLSYPVHSLYLDSDTLTHYWTTINGNKNRYKLRIRFYDGLPDGPVYFEVKRRMNEAILKQRGGVKREFVDWIMAGHMPSPEHLASTHPSHLVAVQRFSQLMSETNAHPKAHVSYLREAWVSPRDNSVRVTMDRDVRCSPEFSTCFSPDPSSPLVVFGNKVVLELKFTGRFPDWFRELVRVFGLSQCSAAKYADGITLQGEQLFTHRSEVPRAALEQDRRAVRAKFLQRTATQAPQLARSIA